MLLKENIDTTTGTTTKNKSIRVVLSEEEYNNMKSNANKMKLSIQEYSRMRLLDSQDGVDSVCRRIAARMPDYYNKVKEIPDMRLQQYFEGVGKRVWQVLK